MNRQRLTVLTALVCLLIATAGYGAGAATYGMFFDSETGTGVISAADSFGYRGNGACIDTNDNWECDATDIPVPKGDIATFSNTSADLVVPESVGTVSASAIDISANGLRTKIDMIAERGISVSTDENRLQVVDATVRGASVTLEADAGELLIGGSTVESTSGAVDLSASDELVGDQMTIDAAGSVTATAKRMAMAGAQVSSEHGEISLTSAGELDVSGAALTTGGWQVRLRGETITANVGTGGATTIESAGSIEIDATRGAGGAFSASSVSIAAGRAIDIMASETITLDGASIASDNGAITIDGGRAVLSGTDVTTNGSIDVTATGAIDLDGGRIAALDYGRVTMSGETISARAGARIASPGAVTVEARVGELDLSGSTVETRYGAIDLQSATDMHLNGTTIASRSGDATATLAANATLYVAGTTIADRGGVLEYSPGSVVVVPSRSDVQPA